MKPLLCKLALAALLLGGCAHPTREVEPIRKPAPPAVDPEPETDPKPFIIPSPFGKHRPMDLTGIPPGTKVQDPTTGGIFRVPESKDDEPVIVSEPPADWHPEN